MSLGLATSLMQMPTARHLLGQILGDLRHGHSVLGLLPEGVDPNLLGSALWDDLGYSDLRIDEVFIPQLDAQTPAAALAQALGVVWGASATPRTVDNLLKQADLPEIIFLDGLMSWLKKIETSGCDLWYGGLRYAKADNPPVKMAPRPPRHCVC